jgi:gliding motility-associated-like protein
MWQDYGRGDVILKNKRLENRVAEKLTAVLHRNRKDIWVIVHRWDSRKFAAYLVTDKGVNPVPVVSETGSFHGGDRYRSIGYLKASPNGRKLASVIHTVKGECQVFDFDNSTGIISNPFMITGLNKPYGVEFSPNGTYLYTGNYSSPSRIYQYNLYAGDSNKINSSKILIANITSGNGIGAYQLGPDRKIYITHYDRPKLSVINNPDKKGSNCNFTLESVDLAKRNALLGLPDFIQSYFAIEVKTDFSWQTICYGQKTAFIENSNASPYAWKWDFNDPQTGDLNYSEEQNPEHTFSKAGQYKVKLTTTVSGYDYSITKTVDIMENPPLDLGEDAVYCLGDSIVLNAGNLPWQKFLWSTKDSVGKLKIGASGKYWVRVQTGNCERSDTINLSFINTDSFHLGNDTAICALGNLWLKGNLPKASYFWNSTYMGDSVKVTQTGLYILQAKVGKCIVSDSQYVTVLPPPNANLGQDTMLCEYDEKLLDAGSEGLAYTWNTGETSKTILAKEQGKYWVNIQTGECTSSDTITLGPCPVVVYMPNTFTPNGDGLNDSFRVYSRDMASGTLSIYNRWGQCIFQTNDIWKGWHGTFNNGPSPVDSYLWILQYKTRLYPDADKKELKGIVNLLR